MKRGQLSLDLMFAVTLIMLTLVSALSLASHQEESARTLDSASKLKVFAIDIRDTVIKAYASGPGFTIKKRYPYELKGNDEVLIVLNSTDNRLEVSAKLDGSTYTVYQDIPIKLVATTSVILNSTVRTFNVTVHYNETAGAVDVRLEKG
jgi:uncharacterized protein (UPF0333 family)